MFAAGHPPLPSFEAAAFSKNLPQHWYDLSQVPFFKKDAKARSQNYADDDFQQTKLVLATCTETMRAMADLIANRATFVGKPRDPDSAWPPPWLRPFSKNRPIDRWPELGKSMNGPSEDELHRLWPEIAMAQSDCYACHHDLKSTSWRQLRGYVGKPGRPQFQSWPFVLTPIALSNDADFAAKLRKLAATQDETPFGTPKSVATAALELSNLTMKPLSALEKIGRDTNEKLLKALLIVATHGLKDYDGARQIAWATRAVYGELRPIASKGGTY